MVGVYNMSVSESTGYNSALGGAYRAVQGSTGQYGVLQGIQDGLRLPTLQRKSISGTRSFSSHY